MTFGIGRLREEVTKQGKQINEKLGEIKDYIPYQSYLEREYAQLIDTNITLKEQLKELEDCLANTQKFNEKLLKYIEKIEEVKQRGGVKANSNYTINGFTGKRTHYDRIYIPGIIFCKVTEEDNYE